REGESERIRNRRPAAAPALPERQEMPREKPRRRPNIQSVSFPPMRCCRLVPAIVRKKPGTEGRLRRSRLQGFLRGWRGHARAPPGRESRGAEREGAAAARGRQR